MSDNKDNKINSDSEQYYPVRGKDKFKHEITDSVEQDFKIKSMPMKTRDEWDSRDTSPDCDSRTYTESKKKINQ